MTNTCCCCCCRCRVLLSQVGIVFTYMAINNFIATLSTIFQKRQYATQAKEKAKKGKSS